MSLFAPRKGALSRSERRLWASPALELILFNLTKPFAAPMIFLECGGSAPLLDSWMARRAQNRKAVPSHRTPKASSEAAMSSTRHPGRGGITRRGFLVGAGAGLAVGAPLGWFALRGWQHMQSRPPFSGRSVEQPRAAGMPGPYPGRVVEVRHPQAVSETHIVNADAVHAMMDRGLRDLTGADDAPSAWRRLFAPSDVIGIKVNPVGHFSQGNRGNTAVSSISSFQVLRDVVTNLQAIGVPPRNIIVFERYAKAFRDVGYDEVLREFDGVRWYASAHDYDNSQLAIDGQAPNQNRDPNVAGYDPDVYVNMGFSSDHHSARDERRYYSHLSTIVTRMVNKIITIPCLKDHRSAGVTLALKNMSHGMNNNVARSHVSDLYRRDGARSWPNQCNTFIPTAVNQRPLKEKATLHIMDGLIGVYEGGPGSWNRSWGTWRRKSLFFATDPVALDHVGWDIIDAQRAREGWLPVSQMGRAQPTSGHALPPHVAALAATNPWAGTLAAANYLTVPDGRVSEFDRRQPEHIMLAGLIGLGRFDAREIDHRVIELGANSMR